MFVGLHRHSHYSRRDAIAKIPDIVARTAQLGQSAFALTDHGTTSGLIEAYTETLKFNKSHGTNLKFIFGCEAYWCPDWSTKDRKASRHILILAKNAAGYRNLLKLVTIGFGDCGKNPDAFFYTMRITTDVLRQFHDGLIVSTACRGGLLKSTTGDLFEESEIAERINALKDIFADDFFLEIQAATDADQIAFNKRVCKISRELEIPVFVSEDSHYVFKSDAAIHRKWLQIDDDSNYYTTDDFFIHPEQEILDSVSYLENASETLRNTSRIADSIEQVEIPTSRKNYPQIASFVSCYDDTGNLLFKTNANKKSEDEIQHANSSDSLRIAPRIDETLPDVDFPVPSHKPISETILDANFVECVNQGWLEKILKNFLTEKKYVDAVNHELDVLKQCDYLDYFALTADFISWSRENGIQIGRGRGSVCGSLVAFLLDITRIDPLKFGLLFERFANTERVSPPDIDVDVPNSKRELIIDYLREKYHEVFHVRTLGTMAEKSAIERAARSLGYSPEQIRDLKKSEKTLDKLDDDALKCVATGFQGVIQNFGIHASAIMLFPSPPTDFCAIEKQGDDYVCAYEYSYLEKMGLLKIDLLGSKTLDAVDECLKLIQKNHRVKIDLDDLPLDDPKTFDMLERGDSIACFQIESDGMKRLLRQTKPRDLFDLIPIVALYRPATLKSGMVDEFISRRNGEKFDYLHPSLEPILKDTYGVLLYQEQAMQIVQTVAGYSLGKADLFRKAIGKKNVKEMDSLLSQFIQDCVNRGIDSTVANKLAEWLENCASYQFNKSHAAAYALVTYQTAFLKANFPAEWLTAYLNAYHDSKQEDLLPYIRYAMSIGIGISKPDARSDSSCWILKDSKIQVAINFIRGVGDIPLPVDSSNLSSLPVDTVASLIKAGALDFLGDREGMLRDLFSNLKPSKAKSLKSSLFFNASPDSKDFVFDVHQAEIETLGFSFEDLFKDFDVSKYSEPDDSNENRVVLCVVREFKKHKQKNNKPMAFLKIETPSGKFFDLAMFNFAYRELDLGVPHVITTNKNKFVRLLR